MYSSTIFWCPLSQLDEGGRQRCPADSGDILLQLLHRGRRPVSQRPLPPEGRPVRPVFPSVRARWSYFRPAVWLRHRRRKLHEQWRQRWGAVGAGSHPWVTEGAGRARGQVHVCHGQLWGHGQSHLHRQGPTGTRRRGASQGAGPLTLLHANFIFIAFVCWQHYLWYPMLPVIYLEYIVYSRAITIA